MKFIKQSSIDTVIQDADIYTVFNHSEKLVKKGTYWFCQSPFGNDKTASCAVNPVKNTFFDYSAGFGGNAIQFLMKKEKISFFEAIEKAAEICGIMLDYEDASEDYQRIISEEQAYKKVLLFANEQYQNAFQKLPADHWAKKMILEQRKYTEETIEVFQIGYAPNERSFISTPLINSGSFTEAKDLGLTNTKDGSSYDFYRNRIMFPIHDVQGNVVGFGGRRSNNEEDDQYAKYLNSKESKIYKKESILYGLYQAKKSIAKNGKAILLEGYTDVIAMHQSGLDYAVATCGTALTENHAKALAKFCKHVIIFRDGDTAGQKAALRDIDALVKKGIKVTVVICPEGEDPDSLCQKTDIASFIEKNHQDGINWKAKVLIDQAIHPDLNELEKTIKEEHEKAIQKIIEDLAPETAFEGLNAMDKKLLKKENDDKFKKVRELEVELKQTLSELPKYEPQLLSQAIEEISNTLHKIPNKIAQKEYVKMVANVMQTKANIIQQVISDIETREEQEKKRKASVDTHDPELNRLPKGASKEQYLEDRFCEIGNTYYFEESKGNFFKGTNFIMTPLFHVEGKLDNKRLIEVINERGQKRLIDLDSKDLINFTRFQERLIDEGNFFWEPACGTHDFKLVAKKLLEKFIQATELKTLGHQREGFFAFADGVFHQNQFWPVNKYGIVHLEGLEAEKSEYKSDIKHYYSPAFSEIYKHVREDDDPYENDRHFVYKISNVSMDQWMKQVVKVFGEKGKFGVIFCLAANFRDLFLTHYSYFPLMGGFGQKDSGKSGMGKVLQSFFFYDLLPLELNNATIPGMSRRLTRCKNVVTFFDEYRDDLDGDKREILKGTWNGLGREKGKGAESNRTTTDKINAAVYYSGQYIPSGDDGALTSRTIVLNFHNKEYSVDDKTEYQTLMNWCQAGITSFVLEVLKHRNSVKSNLMRAYAECAKELKNELAGREYQNRVYENYLVLLTVMKLLEPNFSFPFTYAEFLKLSAQGILENSELIADSDGLAKFWNIVEFLSRPQDSNQPNKTVIKEGPDYIIEKVPSVVITKSRDEKVTWKNEDRVRVLFVNFRSVHQYYHKEVSSRKGEDVIGETTLRNYIKSKKYFIGLFSAKRMGGHSVSGYAFDYDMMERLNILSLDIETYAEPEIPGLEYKKKQIITNPDQSSLDIPPSNSF